MIEFTHQLFWSCAKHFWQLLVHRLGKYPKLHMLTQSTLNIENVIARWGNIMIFNMIRCPISDLASSNHVFYSTRISPNPMAGCPWGLLFFFCPSAPEDVTPWPFLWLSHIYNLRLCFRQRHWHFSVTAQGSHCETSGPIFDLIYFELFLMIWEVLIWFLKVWKIQEVLVLVRKLNAQTIFGHVAASCCIILKASCSETIWNLKKLHMQ